MVPYTGPHTTPFTLGLANILAQCPPSILASKLGHQSPDGWLCKAAEDWLDSWALRRLGDGPELPGGQLQGAYKGKDPSVVIPGTSPNSPSDGPRRGQNAPSSLQMTPNVQSVGLRAGLSLSKDSMGWWNRPMGIFCNLAGTNALKAGRTVPLPRAGWGWTGWGAALLQRPWGATGQQVNLEEQCMLAART